LAPITYSQLIWAAVIGFFIFGEFPGASTWSGCRRHRCGLLVRDAFEQQDGLTRTGIVIAPKD
jgi:drug/metabolite transporter (DMT)-like permease